MKPEDKLNALIDDLRVNADHAEYSSDERVMSRAAAALGHLLKPVSEEQIRSANEASIYGDRPPGKDYNGFNAVRRALKGARLKLIEEMFGE